MSPEAGLFFPVILLSLFADNWSTLRLKVKYNTHCYHCYHVFLLDFILAINNGKTRQITAQGQKNLPKEVKTRQTLWEYVDGAREDVKTGTSQKKERFYLKTQGMCQNRLVHTYRYEKKIKRRDYNVI